MGLRLWQSDTAFHKAPDWHSGEMFTSESWDMAISGGEMVWSSDSYVLNEMANAVRWGNLHNITIITEAEPTIGNATLDFFKPGSPDELYKFKQVFLELLPLWKPPAASLMAPAPRTLPTTAPLPAATTKAPK